MTRLEFLLGKQLPYVGVAMLSFVSCRGAGRAAVPACRSRAASPTLRSAALIYVLASTGFGLLISIFARTQIAAIFGGGDPHDPAGRAILRHARRRSPR